MQVSCRKYLPFCHSSQHANLTTGRKIWKVICEFSKPRRNHPCAQPDCACKHGTSVGHALGSKELCGLCSPVIHSFTVVVSCLWTNSILHDLVRNAAVKAELVCQNQEDLLLYRVARVSTEYLASKFGSLQVHSWLIYTQVVEPCATLYNPEGVQQIRPSYLNFAQQTKKQGVLAFEVLRDGEEFQPWPRRLQFV